tara:strand:- start:7497 stop:8429 length:933 start_codon:yes stop_codon:yes gene_type:complete
MKEKESFARSILIIVSKIWGELIFSIKVLSYLKKNKVKISILHLHSINFLNTALAVKFLHRCKVIMNFGGTDLFRLKTNKLLKFLASHVDAFLYVAQSMESDLDKLFPQKRSFYMGNGVDLTLFSPQNISKPESKNFLAIGNLRWQKGYHYLIEGFSDVVNQFPNIQLSIAGEGPQRQALEDKIKFLGLERHIFLLGVCSREDLSLHLNQSYGFIMSSVSEGFPKALIESIACEVPVIVTDVGECALISQDVGLVVPAENSNAISRAIIDLLEDKVSYHQMKLACRKKRLNFSWTKMTDRVIHAYSEIAK